MFLHRLLNEHMHLECVQDPPCKYLIEGAEVFDPSPEIAEVEVMVPREEEGEGEGEVAEEKVDSRGSARLGLGHFFFIFLHVLLVGTDLLQKHLLESGLGQGIVDDPQSRLLLLQNFEGVRELLRGEGGKQ